MVKFQDTFIKFYRIESWIRRGKWQKIPISCFCKASCNLNSRFVVARVSLIHRICSEKNVATVFQYLSVEYSQFHCKSFETYIPNYFGNTVKAT